MLLSCRPSRRARSVFVVCVRRPRPSFRARAVCVWRFIVLPRPRTSTRRVFLRAARPIARPGPGERAPAARGPAAPHAAERVATVVHPSSEWARARRRAAPRLSSCCRGAAAPRHRCAASGSAAGGGERAMRCRERTAFGEARRRAPGRGQAVVPSGWSAGLGRPARGLERPTRRNEKGLSPARVQLTALSVHLRHQGRLTCSGAREWRATARATEPRGRPHRWRCTAGRRPPAGRIRGRVVDVVEVVGAARLDDA